MPTRTPLEITQRLNEFKRLRPGEYLVADDAAPLEPVAWSDLDGPDEAAAPGDLWALDLTGAPPWAVLAIHGALRGASTHRPAVLVYPDDGTVEWASLRYTLARGH